jgi:predicted ribosomally synthesized peptide with nif11-like leader
MSVEMAVAYIKRMRIDAEFRSTMNETSEDESASWALAKAAGYEFTMSEFKQAQDVVYDEYGIDPSRRM